MLHHAGATFIGAGEGSLLVAEQGVGEDVVLEPRHVHRHQRSLAAFAGTRTPLEKMLLGEKLFLNTPSALSAGVQKPEHPFFSTALAMARMRLTLDLLWGLARGRDVKSRVADWNARMRRFGKAAPTSSAMPCRTPVPWL